MASYFFYKTTEKLRGMLRMTRFLGLLLGLSLIPSLLRATTPLQENFHRCMLALQFGDQTLPATPPPMDQIPFAGSYYEVPRHYIEMAKAIFFSSFSTLEKAKRLQTLSELTAKRRILPDYPDPYIQQFNQLILTPQNILPFKTKEINVVVHQEEKLQAATANFLQSETHLAGKPTLALASPLFSLRSEALIKETDLVQLSEDGRFNFIPEEATTFNVLGGKCQLCVSTAIGSIFNAKYNPVEGAPIEVFVYPSHSYADIQKTDPFNMSPRPKIESKESVEELFSNSLLTMGLPFNSQVGPAQAVDTARGPAYRIQVHTPAPYTRALYIYVLAR